MLNMAGSLFYSVVLLFFRFLVRRLFLESFGVEILGYNSTFNSILNMMNLAELGIGTAITYNLYKPVANNDYSQISNYLVIYKKLYRYIGLFILVLGILIVPVLPIIVKESYGKLSFLAVIFLLQLLSTVSTYWCAYKRIVFNVYQKTYITSIVDTLIFVSVSILQIIDIIIFKNYYFYLFLAILQVVCSNLILSYYCNKKYPLIDFSIYKNDNKIDLGDLRGDISNVLISKLGGYVLNSTDALVVSVILGAVSTGYMTNYTTIFTSFQSLALTMLTTLQPSLGNKIACGDSKKEIEKIILNLTFLSQIIGCIFATIAFVLIDDFIILWVGNKYVLNTIVAGLFSVNVYVFLLMYPISLLFGALGYFKYDKVVVLIAATLNLVLSVILVFNLGIQGVLMGTTLALLIYWVSRSFILYKKFYRFSCIDYLKLIFRCLTSVVISVIPLYIIDKYLFTAESNLLVFVFKIFIYIFIVLGILFLIFRNTKEIHYFFSLVRLIKKEVRKNGFLFRMDRKKM